MIPDVIRARDLSDFFDIVCNILFKNNYTRCYVPDFYYHVKPTSYAIIGTYEPDGKRYVTASIFNLIEIVKEIRPCRLRGKKDVLIVFKWGKSKRTKTLYLYQCDKGIMLLFSYYIYHTLLRAMYKRICITRRCRDEDSRYINSFFDMRAYYGNKSISVIADGDVIRDWSVSVAVGAMPDAPTLFSIFELSHVVYPNVIYWEIPDLANLSKRDRNAAYGMMQALPVP